MIEINELSSEFLTDTEISNRVAALIEASYPSGRELKIMRRYLSSPQDVAAKSAFDAYNAEVELIRSGGVAARVKAALVRCAIEFECAKVRLEKYRLADGRAEKTIVKPTGERIYDEVTMNFVDVTTTEVVPYIPPLSPTVFVTNELGINVEVANPKITVDDMERSAAQRIVDGASLEVLNLVSKRRAGV